MKPFNQICSIVLVVYLVTGCAMWKPSLESMKPDHSLVPEDVWSAGGEDTEEKSLELIKYAEQSDAWRGWAKTSYRNYDDYQKSHHGKIANRDLVEIQHLATQYVDQIWGPLWDLMLSPYFYLDLAKDVQIQNQHETHIEKRVNHHNDSLGEVLEYGGDPEDGTVYRKVRADVYHINPLDRKGKIFLRELEVSFGAALILIDNFEIGWEPYMKNKAIRRILLYDSAGPKDESRQAVQKIWRNYRSYRNSEKLVAVFNLYQKARQIQKNSESVEPGPHSHPLTGIIENSPTFKKLEENPNNKGLLARAADGVKTFFTMQKDSLALINVQTSHIFGKAFGLSADLFQSREGHLKQMPRVEYARLVGTMKSLDVFLQRSRSRLTDKFIPGHYGHVGIWVGTEGELKELGVWEKLPDLYQRAKEKYAYGGPSFQEAVRDGKNLIEALAPGVNFHPLQNFLDADDLVVLRPVSCGNQRPGTETCLTREKKSEYLVNAFRQIGKNYDFSLNFNTDSELVCSEVAYWTFVDFDIKTDRAMGKHYVRPDQMAKMADDPSDPFFPVILYVNGKRVWKEGEPLRKELKHVLNGNSPEEELRER
ncbi:MAG: YiiX/YebB-like N1pC/P60 family cysteine hydrolase [Nitrospinae bacterium]|nr:YiiX/YebB-like N1pC/P60 family cysteine hydrolase [Nitrospinota bacterium]